uniref:Uncharacterized protein n=1 Tax=Amphimedon queenslandica TaxID=400682 RepID=A0A1X7UTJ7_AMPQE
MTKTFKCKASLPGISFTNKYVYSTAGLECRIYVSSSHGINNTSCWTGGVQTPCATIDLAIQGTAILQYNCSSGILINLSPGTYTLDTTRLLEQQLLRNNVSIIGMRDGSRYEEIPLCISGHMSPLESTSFWYVIGFYPLLLLLLLYVWMTLYDKGYKCVVFITRPFHRCMARFWSMTGIEPSFTHSIASIYILCFTQLTATSFKILSFGHFHAKFAFDEKQGYFQGWHVFAGFIAIIVLLFLIVLPTLCILFYPFKWLQKLLDCLHLRKQLLISLGDVFTGPYKNGTENTYDYRFMAGLYLLAKIFILSQFLFGFPYFAIGVPIAGAFLSLLLAALVLIFRPFNRNIHNFTEFLILYAALILHGRAIPSLLFWPSFIVLSFNTLSFGIIIPIYAIYHLKAMIKSCHQYHKKCAPTKPAEEEDNEGGIRLEENWIADRMENPQEYNECHVPVEITPEEPQQAELPTAVAADTSD